MLGDTQRSLWAEEHVLGREQNEEERVRLVAQLAATESPAFVVHLGDLVAKASTAHFRYFDSLMAPVLGDGRTPLLPVLGNHEYFGDGRDPSRSSRLRYPDLANGGYYAKRWRRLGLVFLDSNLTGRVARRQAEWLSRALDALDADPGVDATLVFSHHPPFTNGVARHGLTSFREDLLPDIACSRKALVLFSAHVHGYERFDVDGLNLIVSGGGGGPRVHYRTGSETSLAPASPRLATSLARPLHYVVVTPRASTLSITTRCLEGSPGCPPDGVLDSLDVELRPRDEPRFGAPSRSREKCDDSHHAESAQTRPGMQYETRDLVR